jgi:phosphoribosylcarboxyaminoimidazole (NCAIR) mutase
MPAGIPVATMAIGKAGARNAGIFAAQIITGNDPVMVEKFEAFKQELAEGVEAKAAALHERLVHDGF